MTLPLPAALRRTFAAGLLALAWPALVPAQVAAPSPSSSLAERPAAAAQAPAPRSADCPPLPRPLDPRTVPQALRRAHDRGLLWRVEQGGHTSWLYGTVHAARRDWVLPGPTVLAAVKASDRVALELDLMDPAVMQALQAAMRNPADAPPLPPELARRLAVQREAACADPAMAQLRPEVQIASLLMLSARSEGFDPAYGIDYVVDGLARGLRKPVLSLESAELQMRVLSSDDPKKTVAAVTSGLESLESHSAGDSLATLAAAWSDGRINLLESYGQWCDCLKTPEDRKAFKELVADRNPGLARAIADQHRAGHSVFAAVGALHLVGPQGLPALLAARGFHVERVAFPPATASYAASKTPPAQ